jgi:3-demethoxyubiquinol 3-hydroxylase
LAVLHQTGFVISMIWAPKAAGLWRGNNEKHLCRRALIRQALDWCLMDNPLNPLGSPLDRLLVSIDQTLRTLSGAVHAARPNPAGPLRADTPALEAAEAREAGALMRVNHVGEVCAQALYQAQALAATSPQLRQQLERAAREEGDHLAWTQQRLAELNARPSLLNPLWYAGAFAIGLVAGRLGDRQSLGFVIETERQVEQHLAGHLERLPAADTRSRAIVEAMQADEARHADDALQAGGAELPRPLAWLMKGAARVMTTVAHRV